MAKPHERSALIGKGAPCRPPVSGLLRVAYQVTRERQFEALVDAGFKDLNDALIGVVACLLPDGAHPSDLAERTKMSKQAMNHLLGKLETLGYIKRQVEKERSSTLVFLTRRGCRAVKTIRDTAKRLEAEWALILGQKRFGEFLDMLRQLSSDNAHAGREPSLQRRDRA